MREGVALIFHPVFLKERDIMAKKLKFNFKVNGVKSSNASMTVNESIHMDIERKLTDFAQKAYLKSKEADAQNQADKNQAMIEIGREISKMYDGLQQIADMAMAQKPIKADLTLVLTGSQNFGEQLECQISL